MFWYVLFTMTGREEKVKQLLVNQLDKNIYKPFIPMLETVFKNSKRIIKKELKPMFPSYVFIESSTTYSEFTKDTRNIIYGSADIIRILNYGDPDDIDMREHERNTLLKLYNGDYCVESSSGIVVGDCTYIKEGSLNLTQT